jgi:hypothetical protein
MNECIDRLVNQQKTRTNLRTSPTEASQPPVAAPEPGGSTF